MTRTVQSARRRGATPALLGALTVLISGCGALAPTVCPAIGWVNTLDVEVIASFEVAAVHVCVDDDCATPTNPSSLEGTLLASFTSREGGTWSFETVMQSPDTITIRVLDASGVVRDDREVDLDWRTVGDPGPCGGPASARATVEL